MPFEFLFRLIELLLGIRRRAIEGSGDTIDERQLRAWHNESDRLARTDRPVPGT
jgi:hypothetical protein